MQRRRRISQNPRRGHGRERPVGPAESAWLLPTAITRLRAERLQVVVDVAGGINDRLQPMLLRGDLGMVVGRLSEYRQRAGIH